MRRFKALFLKGDAFFCPCCKKSFSKFLPKGNGISVRENAVCAVCGSLERTRLLYLYLKNETDIFSGNKYILHFAPEAVLKDKFKANRNYTDVDLNPNFASVAMDITDIKFDDNHFDFIICSHVLGHIPDEQKAVDEVYRVLKTGGSVFFLSLMDPSLKQTRQEDNAGKTVHDKLLLYGEKDLERLYGQDFAQRIWRSAVQIEKIDYRKHFTVEQREKMALGDGRREIIYHVKKKRFIS